MFIGYLGFNITLVKNNLKIELSFLAEIKYFVTTSVKKSHHALNNGLLIYEKHEVIGS